MLVRELIDFLMVQDPDAEVELTIVETAADDESSIGVTRYSIAEMITIPDDENDDKDLVWLVGGEEDDIDHFLDAISEDDDFDDDLDDDFDDDLDDGLEGKVDSGPNG